MAKVQFEIGDIFERQEAKTLGCGRHALNNLFGVDYFIKDGAEINDDNIKTFVAGRDPKLPLQSLCRYLRSKIIADGGACLNNEYYTEAVLTGALGILGYRSDRIKTDVSDNTTIDVSVSPNTVGFLGNDGVTHWVAFRKLNNGNFLLLDSLSAERPQITPRQLQTSLFSRVLNKIYWGGSYSLDIDTSDEAKAAEEFNILKGEYYQKVDNIIGDDMPLN